MEPRGSRARGPLSDPGGMFSGMVAFLIENGVQNRRLQIWNQKLLQMGAAVETRASKRVTHVFAVNSVVLLKQLNADRLSRFKGKVLTYQWLEDSLRQGYKVSEDKYDLKLELGDNVTGMSPGKVNSEAPNENGCGSDELTHRKKFRPPSPTDLKHENADDMSDPNALSPCTQADNLWSSLTYNPPDLNRNITELFGKLVDIYRALGEDRRSFSYHKAIAVIEKLPFKIESAEQVKDLPALGKSMQDHIQEIISTGKLSKLMHFETDEKVKTISLFGEVWGIGPATALKLYGKGHRTLDDLKNEDSLTNAQMLGLKYFNDIKIRIPRHEVQEMELILQEAGEDVLPGVVVLCGGSFRRGKASCGDLDVIITHPDGESHRGFLSRYVKHLKDMNFLKEDLIGSFHNKQGTDSRVDTYFGFCTYPGRDVRHRIDLKVYPRDIYAFGLIAWTGNDVLNRRFRLIAESKQYLLDDTGLFLITKGSDNKRSAKASKSLSLKTEREVFDFLEFPWLEPHERNL